MRACSEGEIAVGKGQCSASGEMGVATTEEGKKWRTGARAFLDKSETTNLKGQHRHL